MSIVSFFLHKDGQRSGLDCVFENIIKSYIVLDLFVIDQNV